MESSVNFYIEDCKAEYGGVPYPNGVFYGKAATWNNLDKGGVDASGRAFADIMLPNLFPKQELTRFVKEGHSMRGHGKQGDAVATGLERDNGFPIAATDNGKGLEVAFAYYSTPDAQNERAKVAERLAAGKSASLSIWYTLRRDGFEKYEGKSAMESAVNKFVAPEYRADALSRIGDFSYIRVLKSAGLKRVDSVHSGMDQYAQIQDVKSEQEFSEQGKEDFAARAQTWDATAAEKRIRKATGADDEPNGNYAKYFLWHDEENKDKFGAYKLLIADVFDGKIKIVPKAVFAVAAVLNGARGGVKIPDADKAKIKTRVTALYKQLAKEFDDKGIVAPWGAKSADSPMFSALASFERYEAKGLYEDEITERTDNTYFLQECLSGVRYDITCMAAAADDLGVPFDPESAIDEVLAEFTARYKESWMKEFQDEESEAGEDQENDEQKSEFTVNAAPRELHPLTLRGQADGLGIHVRSVIARAEKAIAARIAEHDGKEARTLSDATLEPMEAAGNAMMEHGKKILALTKAERDRRKKKTATVAIPTPPETANEKAEQVTDTAKDLQELYELSPYLQ